MLASRFGRMADVYTRTQRKEGQVGSMMAGYRVEK